jgi:hypothetical protein
MLTCPRIGQRVVLHYGQKYLDAGVRHHGKHGVVVARKTKGRPRSHLVSLEDGLLVVVPCGNLRNGTA